MTDSSKVEIKEVYLNGQGNTFLKRFPMCFFVGTVALAAVSCIAFTAGFSSETIFAGFKLFIGDLSQYIGIYGPVLGVLLFSVFFIIHYFGWISFGDFDIRAKRYIVVFVVLLTFSLVLRPHNSSHEQSIFNTFLNPPAIANEYKTVWYWVYVAVRYFGIAATLCALISIILYVLRYKNSDTEANGKRCASLCRASKDIFSGCCLRLSFIKNALSRFSVLSIVKLFSLIVICWVPWMIFLWPANIAADTVAQLMWVKSGKVWDPSSHEMLPGYAMSDHHPWLDTVIYGFFDSFGTNLLGSEAWGLWILAVLQTVGVAAAFAIIINYFTGVLKLDWKFGVLFLLFICFTPIFARTAMVVVKDATALPFFLLFMLLIVEYVRRLRQDLPVKIWLVIALIVLFVICAEMRKISLEIFAATFLVLALFLKRRVRSIAVAVIPVILLSVISSVAFPALHIASGGRQETVGVFFQQTMYTAVNHEESLSSNDRAIINAVNTCSTSDLVDIFALQDAKREINSDDALKDRCFNRDASSKDVVNFMALWIKLGVRHPLSYLHAVPWLKDPFTMGAFYDEGWYVRGGWEDMGTDKVILPQYHSDFTSAEKSKPQEYGSVIYAFLAHMPGVSFFMSEATYVVWIPVISLMICLWKKKYQNLVFYTPWVLTIMTLLLLPAHQTRYTWTLAFGAIMIIAIPFIELNGGKNLAEASTVKE